MSDTTYVAECPERLLADEGRGEVRNDISLSELDLNDLLLPALFCSHNLTDQEY